MAFERNKTVSDFETMLRRHLEQSNRLAAPCSEFDAEVASAYLEGAVSGQLSTGYESHLAGCATCRHALVMLRKMTPVEPGALPSQDHGATWWQAVKDVLAGPAWGVGLAVAAGAVVVAFGVYAFRRPSQIQSAEVAMSTRAAGSAVASESAPIVLSSPSGQLASRAEPRRESSERRVHVTPNPNSLPVIGAAPSASLVQPPEAPKTENEVKTAQAPAAESQVATAVQSESRSQAGGRKEEQRQEASQPAQTQERAIDEKGARRLAPREAKAKAQATPAPRSNEDENFHPLIRKVRDKSFRFDRGVWIDQEYKPENRLQRTRLMRGTPDYDRALTENPALAPFFDLGAVVVVWQGRVYEVRKQ
jgi:hypothetical protein